MKTNRILHTITSLLLIWAVLSCTEEDMIQTSPDSYDIIPGKISLTLILPQETLVQTRATSEDTEAERTIRTLTIVSCNSKGEVAEVTPITFIPTASGENGARTIELNLQEPACTLHVIANADIDKQTKLQPTAILSSGQPNLTNGLVMWGAMSLLETSREVKLLRMAAKVTVESSGNDLNIRNIGLYHTAVQGYIAPTNMGALHPYQGSGYTQSYTAPSPSSPIYFYETPGSADARIVIQAAYGGKDYCYPIALVDEAGKALNLLRNHHYQVIIRSVDGPGYDTTDMGSVADKHPLNISVQIVDANAPIRDIIVCGGYELGVSGNMVVPGLKSTKDVYVFSTSDDPIQIGKSESWVTVSDTPSDKREFTLESGQKGWLSTYSVTIAGNTSVTDRETGLTIKSGMLLRTITITQEGLSFLDFSSRKIRMYTNNNALITDDYLASLQQTGNTKIYGTRPEDMEGISRLGLHFNVLGDVEQFHYTIDCESGETVTADESKIACSVNGNLITVTKKDNDDESLWETTITVKDKEGYTKVTYPVFNRGLIHEIKYKEGITRKEDTYKLVSQQIVPAGSTDAKHGWFYYEFVDLGNDYYIMDRNVGSASNGFYSDITGKGNTNAIGGYYYRDISYKLEGSKNVGTAYKTPCKQINGKLSMFERNNLESINSTFKFGRLMTNDGTQDYGCYLTPSNAAIQQIYFPLCQYIEGYTYEVTETEKADALRGVKQGEEGGYYWLEDAMNEGMSDALKGHIYYYEFFCPNGKSLNTIKYTPGSGVDYDPYRAMQVRCLYNKKQ